jgi:hypothetical protein
MAQESRGSAAAAKADRALGAEGRDSLRVRSTTRGSRPVTGEKRAVPEGPEPDDADVTGTGGLKSESVSEGAPDG